MRNACKRNVTHEMSSAKCANKNESTVERSLRCKREEQYRQTRRDEERALAEREGRRHEEMMQMMMLALTGKRSGNP